MTSTEAKAGGCRRTSELLRQIAASHPGPRVSIGDLADALGERGFGLLILLLALPNALPGPAVPGLSALFAAPLALILVQLMLGRGEPALPKWLRRCSISVKRFRAVVARLVPVVQRVERRLRPRQSWLTGPRGMRALAVAMLVFTLVLALPVPFGNWAPAIALSLIALGLLEHDARALELGRVMGVAACLWICVLFLAGAKLAVALGAVF
jgi:hypothetical protein